MLRDADLQLETISAPPGHIRVIHHTDDKGPKKFPEMQILLQKINLSFAALSRILRFPPSLKTSQNEDDAPNRP